MGGMTDEVEAWLAQSPSGGWVKVVRAYHYEAVLAENERMRNLNRKDPAEAGS